MLILAQIVECSNLFRLTLAHLQWLSRRLLLVEGSAQKSLKLSPRVSFPPRLAHLDQFKPIFETWLTTPAGTSIWMAEPPLSAPAPPCQHNKFQYFRKTPRISWRGNFLNRWIDVWRGNRRPHKYPSWTDLTRRVIDYQMAGKRDCHQPTLIRALTNNSRYTHEYVFKFYWYWYISNCSLFSFSLHESTLWNVKAHTKKMQTSDIFKLLICLSVVWQKWNLRLLSEKLPQEPN